MSEMLNDKADLAQVDAEMVGRLDGMSLMKLYVGEYLTLLETAGV